MKGQPASSLQKISFVLLLFIAAALTYLIVRDRLRSDANAQSATGRETTSDSNDPVIIIPPGMTSSFAPLRPRQSAGGTPPSYNRTSKTLTNRPDLPGKLNEVRTVATPEVALGTADFTPAAPGSGGSALGITPSIVGRVLLRGVPPPERRIQLDAMCGRLHSDPMFTRHFVVDRSGALANVFVYIKEGAPRDESQQPSTPVLDNVNCIFEPYVLGVRTGQPFQWRNSDPVLHNMHVIPAQGSGNREMNIGMPVKGMTLTKTLQHPEVFVKVKCDVHPWMFAYLGVVAHRWFAVTDSDGRFALPPGLPAGRYIIAALHQKAGEQTREITHGGGDAEPVTFTFDAPAR
jgi:plastocyanin